MVCHGSSSYHRENYSNQQPKLHTNCTQVLLLSHLHNKPSARLRFAREWGQYYVGIV